MTPLTPLPRAPLALPMPLVITVVTLLTAVQPVATDLYLPALPALRDHFGSSVAVVQLTLAVLVFCFGLSQLLWGPATDRWGRRPVLLLGLGLYSGAAIVGALTPSIELLIAARGVQGIGMAASMVCGRAMVRDLFEPAEGTRVMTQAMSLLSLISMSAPVIGSFIAASLGWRFAVLAPGLFGLAALTLVLLRVPETIRVKRPDATRLRPLLADYLRIGRHAGFLSWTGLNATGYAAYFGFFSAGAYLFIEHFGLSRLTFALIIGSGSVAYLGGTLLCRRWIRLHGIQGAVRRGGWMTLTGAIAMLGLQLLHAHTPLTLTAALWLHLVAYGVTQPCGQVGLAAPFPHHAGAASALGGFAFAAAAFLAASWLGSVFDGQVGSVAWTTGCLMAVSGLIALTAVRRHGTVPLRDTASVAPSSPVP
ncbi:MAG: multidrug effflux MFS transporter [Burkholderiales bacterium]